MATTAAHNSSRATDESSELLEQHLPELGEPESSSTADYPPTERQVGIALADADETGTSEIQPSSGLGDALKAERRRSNNLEKELRGLRQQLTRFSEINPEEYARLQQAERQKQLLEQQVELRERQMEEASARKVAAVAAERDAAHERVQELRKERLPVRPSQKQKAAPAAMGAAPFFRCSRGSWARAFALPPARTASMCWNRWTVRDSRCWGMTAGH